MVLNTVDDRLRPVGDDHDLHPLLTGKRHVDDLGVHEQAQRGVQRIWPAINEPGTQDDQTVKGDVNGSHAPASLTPQHDSNNIQPTGRNPILRRIQSRNR